MTTTLFKNPFVFIVGFGDIAQRTIPYLVNKFDRPKLFGLFRPSNLANKKIPDSITPVLGDLDDFNLLRNNHYFTKILPAVQVIIYLAPPPNEGNEDSRMKNFLKLLGYAKKLRKIIYISTTGVYGDCNGEWVSEIRPTNPQSARAKRRVDAENRLYQFYRDRHQKDDQFQLLILRVPGIYAFNRINFDRYKKHIPSIIADEDVYTNHIHAEDLAKIIIACFDYYKKSYRIFNVSDDSHMKMGDYFDFVADIFNFEHCPRYTKDLVKKLVTPATFSFMSESRRIANHRMKEELRYRLTYPVVNNYSLTV